MGKNKIAEIDDTNLVEIRTSVDKFMQYIGEKYVRDHGRLLDIAPQDHKGVKPFLTNNVIVETLDIDPNAKATYTTDLCECKCSVPDCYFNYVVCTEVLEHTRQPFTAVNNIYRILKPSGICFISTPFNFRIHGPLPDCWRFTEYGLRELFSNFKIIELSTLETPDRFLMPIHYTLVACKVPLPKDL